MAEQRELRFLIVVDKKTGAVRQVKQEIEGINRAASKLPKTLQKSQNQFKNIAATVGKIGVAAFFIGIISRAVASQKSFENFQSTIESTVNGILEDLAPALELMFNGLSGLIKIIGTLVKVMRTNLITVFKALSQAIRGNFSGALKTIRSGVAEMGDIFTKGIIDAGQRASGALQETLKGQAKIIQSNAIIAIRDVTLTNKQRLEIIRKAEEEINKIVATSTEFQNKNVGEREKARLKFIQSLRSQSSLLEEEILRDEVAAEKVRADQRKDNIDADLALRMAAIQERLQNERLSREQILSLIKEMNQLEIEAEEEKFQIESTQLQEAMERDNDITAQAQAELEALKQDHQNKLKSIDAKGKAALRTANRKEVVEQSKIANDVFKIQKAVAGKLIGLALALGEGQKKNAREVAADLVRTIGQQASAAILANAAEGASAHLKIGLAGLGPAAAVLAKGAALAAGVAAVTGVAAKTIGGVGGGGGGGEQAEIAPPAEVEAPGGVPGVEAPAGAPPSEGGGGLAGVSINIFADVDVLQIDAVAQRIGQEVERARGL